MISTLRFSRDVFYADRGKYLVFRLNDDHDKFGVCCHHRTQNVRAC